MPKDKVYRLIPVEPDDPGDFYMRVFLALILLTALLVRFIR